MSVVAFLDTNVLLYAEDSANPQKQERAQSLIDDVMQDGSGRISLQVLQEYFSIATRKLRLEPSAARRQIELYSRMDVVRLEPNDLLAAIDLHRLNQFSIWDALILRAALISGCRVLYTEDLQAGFRLDSLTVVNPFA